MELAPAKTRTGLAAQWLVVAALYFVSGWAIAQLRDADLSPVFFWPSAGWALFAVYALGYRNWPGIALGQLLLLLHFQSPLPAGLGTLPGSAVQALAGAWLLRRRTKFRPALKNLGDAFWFVGVVVFATVPVSATLSLGVKGLAGGYQTFAEFGMEWWQWALGDALGIIVVFPFLHNWLVRRPEQRGGTARMIECLALSTALQGVALAVFNPLGWFGPETKFLAFLPWGFLLWLSGRFGMRTATLNLLLVSVMVCWGAAAGTSEILDASAELRGALRTGFLFMLALSSMFVAASAEDLSAWEGRVRSLVVDSPDGIFLLNEEGRLVDANEAGRRMLGLTHAELSGDTGGGIPAGELAALDPDNHALQEREWKRRDGSVITVEINARRLTDGRVQAVARDITARLAADAALRESERFARRILDTTPNIIYVFDIATQRNVYSNHQIAALLGYAPGEVAEMGDRFLAGVLHPDDLARVPALLSRWDRASDTDLLHTEYRMKARDGRWRWFHAIDAVFRRDAAGRVVQIIGNALEVTAQHESREELRRENDFNQSIIASAGEGICVCHEIPDFPFVRFTVWNDRMLAITGHTLEEINRLGWYQTMYPDPTLQQRAVERMRQMRGGDDLHGEQWEITRKDGTRRQILITTRLVRGRDDIPNVLAVMNDITESLQARQAAAEATQWYRRAIEATRAVPYLQSHDSEQFTFVGEGIVQLTGYTAEEMTRELWNSITESSIVRGEGAGLPIAEAIELCRSGRIREWHCDTRIRTRAGELRWLEDSAVEIYGPDGTATGSIGILTDITERKQAEGALRDSEARFRAFLDHTPAAVFMKDEAGRYLVGNAAWAAQFGRPIDELLGRTDDELWDEKTAQTFRTSDRQMLEGDHVVNRIEQGFMPDGTVHWWSVMKFPVHTTSGQRLIGGIALDITDRKLAEDEVRRLNTELEIRVRQRTDELNRRVLEVERLNEGMFNLLDDLGGARTVAERNAAEARTANRQLRAINQELEAFSYSISHDLRAPLRHIHGFVRLLQKEAAAVLDDSSRNHLRIIADSASRMGRLIDDLLEFSRAGRSLLHPGMVDLNELVADVKEELERGREAEGRTIEWRIGVLPPVWGDRSLLRQVFYNLVSNAVKYTARRTHALIEIGAGDPAEPGEVSLFIRDNGTGFDMQFADKLFGVFQRLHRADEFDGTGIGLANVRRILHRHGGRIRAEAKPDQGATFLFSLPASREAFAEHQSRTETDEPAA